MSPLVIRVGSELWPERIAPTHTEYRFDQARKWAADFAWPDVRLLVEREGGLYGRGKRCPVCKRRRAGAHSSVERLLSDLEKYNRAEELGWALLRYPPGKIAYHQVEAVLVARGWTRAYSR